MEGLTKSEIHKFIMSIDEDMELFILEEIVKKRAARLHSQSLSEKE